MNCPACAHANRPGAKFCEECAAPLDHSCASCAAKLRPTAKFCDECGAPVAGPPPAERAAAPAGARKTVTIVFADLVGSTALHERLDAESARRFMESYYAAMRGAVEAHGGTVTQLLGDGVKALFGIPRVAEDDALRAVRAAVAMQDAFRALAEQQRGAVGRTGLRVAVNTGEVVANDASEIIGDPVNVAARLQEQGRDGDVVVGEATARLVSSLVTLAPLGSFALKGRSGAVSAYRVDSLERPEGAAATPFVGRDEEIARITQVYETAVEKPATGLVVLLGSPGLGKSRLIDEFGRRQGDAATIVAAHCDAAGGTTFAPLADALRELLEIEAGASADGVSAATLGVLPQAEAERARIASGIAALISGSPASPEETFFVLRRLLAALASLRPVVLVIDDLHWAEPLLLDLVEHLVQWGSGVPLLLLVGARPELRELRSSLVTPGGLVSDVVTLAGLDAGAAMRLAANVIGAADLPAAVAAKVLATSEGNPLFVGELVRMLVQEGALTKQGDRWAAGTALAALEMPPTIHALLAARIERLRSEDRAVLERAAVIGRHFSRSAVAELLPDDATDLDARLESLRRSELIERDSGWFLGEPVLRFHHVLIRDAAYRRLLKGTRAELHARFADWVETKLLDAIEHEETIGWHLEQAHQHLRELGPIDAHGRALGVRAATHLAAAGRRALARDDLPLAASLLGRALERLDSDDPARADLALDWCEALLAAGAVGPAAAAIRELGRFTDGSARLRAWHTCFTGQHTVLTDPSALLATVDQVAAAASELVALGDGAGEAKAHFVHALALSRLGKVGACEAALDRALAAARRAGDRRRANSVLAIAPLAALWGPSPVTRASGRCLDVVRVLRITQGAPAVEAVALSCQGVLEALRGRTEAARRMIASARKMVEELGITQRLLEADVFGGLVLLLEGDAAAAETTLRGAYEGLRELGLGIDAARAAALLARALLAQDRVAEAEAQSHQSEALAGDDLKAAIAWRGVRAEALARRGEHAEATQLASQAVGIAAATDALLDHADARLALAAALRAAGHGREADAEEQRATELWEAKGATLLAERARSGAVPVSVAAARPEPVATMTALRRGVRPNLATALLERIGAASADYEVEPLATLGEFLALGWRRTRADGATSDRAGAGAHESEAIQLFEVDARGLSRRPEEVFQAERLGEAIGRLFERYAELLPEGAARARAEATARSVGVVAPGGVDLDCYRVAFRQDAMIVDHRLLGLGSGIGSEALFRSMSATGTIADQLVSGGQELLALTHDGLLMRWLVEGVGRESGGAFEWAFLRLFVFGSDGHVTRYELFDADREAAALVRFAALVAVETRMPVRHPARANVATLSYERMAAALTARDGDALEQVFDESLHVVHHPSGLTYGRREMLVTWRSAMNANRLDFRQEILASLGDSLALDRHVTSVEGLAESHLTEFGVTEFHELSLIEVDARGRWLHVEIFATDRLADAIARLYARYAELLPEGPERERVAGAARSLAGMYHGLVDRDRLANPFTPEVECVDHRIASFGTLHGDAAVLEAVGAFLDLVDDARWRVDDVLALSDRLMLALSTNLGTARVGGGSFERVILSLYEFAADGRIARWEPFEAYDAAAALARFDALSPGEALPAAEPFENVAARTDRRLFECFNARDWAGVEALAAPELVFDERRRMLHNSCGREVWLEQFRLMFDVPNSRFTSQLLATRGERLSLNLHRFEGEVAGGGGPLEMDDHYALHEVAGDGRIVAIVLFDQDDLAAAHVELDRRYVVGEDRALGAYARFMVAFAQASLSRDWDPVQALCAPALVEHDHRPLAVLGTTRGAEAWVRNFRVLSELAPDSRYRVDHFRSTARGFCTVGVWRGTREGGPYEIPLVAVLELDEQRRMVQADIYDGGQLAQARARFDELASAAPQPFANAATRTVGRAAALLTARDWAGFAALFAPQCRIDDRTAFARGETDRSEWLAALRRSVEMTAAHPTSQVLATRGERLVLFRMLWLGADGDFGPSDIDWLLVVEVDGRGDPVAVVSLDPSTLAAAYAELDARWQAGEGSLHPRASSWQRDLAATQRQPDPVVMASFFAPVFVARDHRLVGWGTLHGGVAFLETVRLLNELAPDVAFRADHMRATRHGALSQGAWVGTREGGAFESPLVSVVELDAHGQAVRLDLYDPQHRDAALARFDEIAASASPHPLAAFAAPNQATASLQRTWAVFDTLAFDAARGALDAAAHFAPDFVWEDRRPVVGLAGGLDLMLASARERLASGARHERRTIVGTAGERVAIARVLWAGGPPDGRFEVELLVVHEVDEAGLCRALLFFEPDDVREAQREAWARWAAIDPAAAAWVDLLNAVADAWNGRDRASLRACFVDEVVVEDHRHAGLGRIEGADAYVESNVALWELAPDQRIEFGGFWPALDRRGAVLTLRRSGTLSEGGAFESEHLWLCLAEGGRITRLELFEIDALDAALARFEALR